MPKQAGNAKRVIFGCLVVVTAVPVFYVVSSGPIIFFYNRLSLDRVIPPSTLLGFYEPLGQLYDSQSSAGVIFRKYIDFWLNQSSDE